MLLVVRHGETDYNRQACYQGSIDIPLNPGGQAQALTKDRWWFWLPGLYGAK